MTIKAREVRIKEGDNLRKRVISVIAIVLCVSLVFGGSGLSYASAQEQESEAAVSTERDKTLWEVLSQTVGSWLFGNTQSDATGDSSTVTTPFLIVFVHETPNFFGAIKTIFFVGTKVKIKGFDGYFCLVENGSAKGYVFKGWLDGGKDGELSLNREYDHVYIGKTNKNPSTGNPRTQAIYDGSGKVVYSTDKTDVISVDSETGLITGKKKGTANLIARVGDVEVSIPVYCIYQWKKEWTGKASKATTVYSGPSKSTTQLTQISSGTKFVVKGDEGGSDGWAYGVTTVNGKDYWGYIPISHVSTKNTISYYSSLGWGYPLKNEKYNYIYSPFAPRSSLEDEHRGIDINEKDEQKDIEGETVIAAFDGVVKESGYSSSAGYYICIISKTDVDPVTGKNLVAIYMHLREFPLYTEGNDVNRGQTIGYVGNTGKSTGSHLHFEVNNIDAVVDDKIRQSYTYTINPIYFYRDRTFVLNDGCSAEKDGYGFYWYNYDK